MTAPFDLARLEQARAMAAKLPDAQLAKELRGDRSAVLPEAWQALEEEHRRRSRPPRVPLLATTPTVHLPLRRVLGVVSSECVMGMGALQETLAGFTDAVGGRSTMVQSTIGQAREALLNELSANATAMRADAVLSITFAFSEWSGQNKSMLILLASGTAVELDFDQPTG